MPPLTLRLKLLLFAVAIAILPILVAGYTMIRIAQDELKSSANEQLLAIATGVAREINDVAERTWLGPLLLIRNAVDDPSLSIPGEGRALDPRHLRPLGHRRAADHDGGLRPAADRDQGRLSASTSRTPGRPARLLQVAAGCDPQGTRR